MPDRMIDRSQRKEMKSSPDSLSFVALSSADRLSDQTKESFSWSLH